MAVILLAVGVPLADLGLTLVRPSSDPTSVRTVEWLRQHGGRTQVNAAERWWYTNHPPPVGGTPPRPLPAALAPAPVTRPSVPVTPAPALALAPIPPLAQPTLPGEGRWIVSVGTADRPAIATAQLRPDAVHTSLLAGVARIDPRYARLELLPGTEQPGAGSTNGGRVPVAEQGALIGVFNAGFLQRDSQGGWYADGRTVSPLRDGAASLVVRRDGSATVGSWGRDVQLTPEVASVRQNLSLLVDRGTPVAGVNTDKTKLWGSTLGSQVAVWRSGAGVTSDGAIVYVGGPGLSVSSLAAVLAAAGAVRAMELDINAAWVTMSTYRHSPNGPVGTKLLDGMQRAPQRYLQGQSRDFFAVLAR